MISRVRSLEPPSVMTISAGGRLCASNFRAAARSRLFVPDGHDDADARKCRPPPAPAPLPSSSSSRGAATDTRPPGLSISESVRERAISKRRIKSTFFVKFHAHQTAVVVSRPVDNPIHSLRRWLPESPGQWKWRPYDVKASEPIRIANRCIELSDPISAPARA